jgi:hypothetical protein
MGVWGSEHGARRTRRFGLHFVCRAGLEVSDTHGENTFGSITTYALLECQTAISSCRHDLRGNDYRILRPRPMSTCLARVQTITSSRPKSLTHL